MSILLIKLLYRLSFGMLSIMRFHEDFSMADLPWNTGEVDALNALPAAMSE